MSRVRNVIVNTMAGFMMRIANMIARFMLQTALIYVLGIQYTGISGLFTSILTILSLAELGIGNAIAFELYKPLAEGNKQRVAALMHFYKIAYRLVALIVLVIGIALIPFLKYIIKDVPDIRESIVLIYVMYIFKTVASYLLVYKSTLLVANQKNYVISRIQSIMSIMTAAFECGMLIITRQFISYLIIEIVSAIVQNIWISHSADQSYPELSQYKSSVLASHEKLNLLSNIKGLSMYKASFALGSGVNNIIISMFVNTSTVGLVSNYTLIRSQLEQLISQFYNAATPSIGNLSVSASASKQREIFSNLLFMDFWISCFCAISYFMLIQPFISIWLGKKYLLSIVVGFVISVDFFLSSMLNPISSFRNANGIFKRGQYRPLIMVIINVLLSILLGKMMGVVGVFLATVMSRLLTQWYDPFLLYKLVFKKSPKNFFVRYYLYLMITIVLGVLTYTCATFINPDNMILTVMLRILLCIVIPNVFIITMFYRTREFQYCTKIGVSILRKIIRRNTK